MNNVIQKCVEELNKDTPRIDYIRGMLESLLVMNAPPTFPLRPIIGLGDIRTAASTVPKNELSDEEQSAVEHYEKGPIGKLHS